MEDIFSIGEVSRLLEVPAATIRFWEQEGLISPCKGGEPLPCLRPQRAGRNRGRDLSAQFRGPGKKDPSAPPL